MEGNENTKVKPQFYYTMRGLQADDLFLMVKIVDKIGMDRLKKCMESETVKLAVTNMMKEEGGDNNGDILTRVGIAIMTDVAGILMKCLSDVKDDLYTLLAGVYGLKAKEMGLIPMHHLARMIKEFINHEEFKDFFTELFGSLN